jgi:cytochrome c oxidase cbb3-type subunit 3/ubiquinol-cytochrome c reductase cytochrome c subunit
MDVILFRNRAMKIEDSSRVIISGIFIIAAIISVSPRLIYGSADEKTANSLTPGISQKGPALYQTYCSMCHGADGEGYLADEAIAISNQDFLVSATDAYILQGILRGRPGTPMAAWDKEKGGPLTRQDAMAIVSFFRTWQKEPSIDVSQTVVAGNAENGGNIYEQWCAACHGKYGAGGKAVKLNNPVFQETASDGFIRYAIENGRRQTPMTAYKKILDNPQMDDGVCYIRTLKPNTPLVETVAADTGQLSKLIEEKGVLNPGKPAADFSLKDNRYVPADDVFAAYSEGRSFIIIDARPQSDFLRSHITGALSIPFYDIDGAVGLLPKDVWIIFYCVCPHALSGRAADKLKAAGYDKVGVLDEGFFFWQNKGYPSETPINAQFVQ